MGRKREKWGERKSQDYMALGASRGGRGDFGFKEGNQEREERKMSAQPAREAGKCWARMGRVRWNSEPSEAKVEADPPGLRRPAEG